MTRVLFLTSLYSTPLQPKRSPPNARIARAMRAFADVRAVVPLPWYPALAAKKRADLASIVETPERETEIDGAEVLHPRYLHLPKIGRPLYPWLYAASVAAPVRRVVIDYRPDVILSAWAFPDGIAAVAIAKALGVPSVLRVMGSDINAFGQERARRPQIQWVLRNSTRIIAVSAALRDACVELEPRSEPNIDVIPTGVDLKKFFPSDRAEARAALDLPIDRPVVLVPARVSIEKGVQFFVEALAKLPKEVFAVSVGGGPEQPRLAKRAAELGLGDRIRWVDHVDEKSMRLHYVAADLACLPSTEEGWPNVLAESFACGCPWVASNVGGVPDIQKLAPGGLLAKPGDAEDLAAALRVALHKPWDRAAIAAGGASISLEDTARKYVATCDRAARTRAA
ncbi:MAG: glycosyltransferase [Polyangiaceae bacterium]